MKCLIEEMRDKYEDIQKEKTKRWKILRKNQMTSARIQTSKQEFQKNREQINKMEINNKIVEIPRHKGLKIKPQRAHTWVNKEHHCEISE